MDDSTTPAGLPPEDAHRLYWDDMPCYLSVHDREFRIIDGNRRFREDFGGGVGELCYRVYKGRDTVCPRCPVEATCSCALTDMRFRSWSTPHRSGTMPVTSWR